MYIIKNPKFVPTNIGNSIMNYKLGIGNGKSVSRLRRYK